ncbi:MAG: sodium:proton antiporter [Proteobacteria bacterium]|nr:sodium:proton antiporter [Pseudomonadota bacterium]
MASALATGVLIIIVGGVAAQWLAWRFRLPAIVLLLAVGLLAGPVFEVIHPSRAMAGTLGPMVGLAVCIVVFEGGLALNLRELRAAGEGVLRLTVVALPISFVLGTVAARACTGMSWGAATLYGAITVVTGPTVILPLLRHTRLDRRAASFLKWEAIVNDPVGALLAAVVLDVATTKGGGVEAVGASVVAGAALAVALGAGAAFLVRFLFTRDLMPEPLKTPVLLALAMGVYVLGNLSLSEAGLIASTVFGVALANLRVPGLAELRRFKEALVVLIVSALFITLAADLDRHVLTQLSWPLIGLTTAMLILVRPAAIGLATVRSGLTWQERAITGWIAPRGIVAAAVAGVAGLRMQSAGIHGANLIMPAVFALITATVILHGFSLGPLARRLKLRLGATPGLAIVGASDWSTDLAACLHQAGVGVLLVDTYPGALKPARALGLPVLQAELLSDHGEEALESRAIDWVLAATPNDIYNGLVCARLGPDLGRERVFQTGPSGGLDPHRWVSRDWRGKVLGAPPWEASSLSSRYAAGWRFAAITLQEAALPDGRVPLIHVRHGAISLVSVEDEATPKVEAGDIAIVFGEVPVEHDEAAGAPETLAHG